MAIIRVGSLNLPDDNLTGYTLKMSDIDSANTGRSENGRMIRERVRQNVYSLEATYEMLTDAQVAQLVTATNPASLSVTIDDGGSAVTKTMYRSGDLDKTMRARGFWDVTVSLIEYSEGHVSGIRRLPRGNGAKRQGDEADGGLDPSQRHGAPARRWPVPLRLGLGGIRCRPGRGP
jgi:hypothetical protein